MYYILIDSGTTNTRGRLVNKNLEIIDIKAYNFGVRNTALDGHNLRLVETIKNIINYLTNNNNIDKDQIEYVIASGMITSEMGLIEIPHCDSPVNINKLSENIVVKSFEEIFYMKFIFIPGVRNNLDKISSYEDMDIMRGEEVEALGLIERFSLKEEGLIIIPGSHSKFIQIGKNKDIVKSYSTLAGETIEAIKNNTILSKSLGNDFKYDMDREYLLKGYNDSGKYGTTRALYNVRLMGMYEDINEDKINSYYVGCIIYNDIKFIKQSIDLNKLNWIVISGNNSLKEIFNLLLKKYLKEEKIILASKEDIEKALVLGNIEILKKFKRGRLNEK